MKFSYFKYILPPLLLGSAFYLNKEFLKPRPLELTKQDEAINVSDTFLKYASSSYRLLTTDLLWITTLLESDLDHYKEKDLNSWMYLRFKSIIELDPNFLMAYQYGGQYLNIIKDDLEGSREIFEAGLKKFPNDYSLIRDAAFLYAFELEENARAAELYEKALTFPQAPVFYHSILSKLRLGADKDPQDVFQYLYSIYKSLEENSFKNKLYNDLYALKAQIDLKCLNEDKPNCSQFDFNNERYIKNAEGNFISQRDFEEYRLFKRKREQ